MEPHLINIQNELSVMRGKIDKMVDERVSDRVDITEDVYAIRVSISSFETRLKVLEDGMLRLMSHSTWLLRLLTSGILVAVTQFVLDGGLRLGQ
jgi:hypothetical protein